MLGSVPTGRAAMSGPPEGRLAQLLVFKAGRARSCRSLGVKGRLSHAGTGAPGHAARPHGCCPQSWALKGTAWGVARRSLRWWRPPCCPCRGLRGSVSFGFWWESDIDQQLIRLFSQKENHGDLPPRNVSEITSTCSFPVGLQRARVSKMSPGHVLSG